MSEITFTSLKLKNFLSIAEGEIGLENRGLLLIQGQNNMDPSANSNGSGKSSLVDSLCWALFGTTARGVGGDAVVNRKAAKNCEVEVCFRDGSDDYKVQRFRKHKTGKNRLMVFKNGDDQTLGTDKQTEELLQRIIGCSQEVFTSSIYAGQERMPDLPGMTDKELKSLVEEAAGVTILNQAYDIARGRSLAAKSGYEKAESQNDAALDKHLTAVEILAQAVLSSDKWLSEQGGRVDAAGIDAQTKLAHARKIKEEVDAFDKAAHDAEVAAVRQQIEDAKPPERPAPAKLSPLPTPQPAQPKPTESEAHRKLTAERNAAASVTMRGLKQQLDKKEAELASVASLVGTPCDSCGKQYHATDLVAKSASLESEIATIRASIADGLAAIRDMDERIAIEAADLALRTRAHGEDQSLRDAEFDDEVATIKASNRVAEALYDAALKVYNDAVAKLDTRALVAKLSAFTERAAAHARTVAALTAALTEAKRARDRTEELKGEVNPHTATITAASARVDAAAGHVTEVGKALKLAVEEYEAAQNVVKLFSPTGIRGEILDQVTPFLNDRSSRYLGTLSDGNISATWSTLGETAKGDLREKFHIAVDSKTGGENFASLSGGEKRKVRIATAMALQDLVASRAHKPIKLFVADEVDDALDVSGLERLMAILEDKAKTVGTTLIISHNSLSDWCSNEVFVIKDSDGVSSIVEL